MLNTVLEEAMTENYLNFEQTKGVKECFTLSLTKQRQKGNNFIDVGEVTKPV